MIVSLPDGSVRQLHCGNCGRAISKLSDLRASIPTFRMDEWRSDDGERYMVKVFVGTVLHCASCAISKRAGKQNALCNRP